MSYSSFLKKWLNTSVQTLMPLSYKMIIIVNCFFTHSYQHVNKINIYLWALIYPWV